MNTAALASTPLAPLTASARLATRAPAARLTTTSACPSPAAPAAPAWTCSPPSTVSAHQVLDAWALGQRVQGTNPEPIRHDPCRTQTAPGHLGSVTKEFITSSTQIKAQGNLRLLGEGLPHDSELAHCPSWGVRGEHSFHSHHKVHSVVHCTQKPVKEEQNGSLCSCQFRMLLLITETLPCRD